MAIAERLLAAEFNRPGHELVDHRTYAFLGDGCMMEGVSHEACALAGTLGLGKLIAVYDDNGISIDSDKGSIKQWYTDDVRRRFEAYGWQVIAGVDGHDVEAMDRALRKAKRERGAADADLREDHHRQGRAHQGQHRRRARRAARRQGNRGDARGDRLALSAVRDSRAACARAGTRRKRASAPSGAGSACSTPTRRRIRSWRRNSCGRVNG